MFITIFAVFIALGAFVGFFAGLLGIGGGLIIVPALAYFFSLQDIAPEYIMPLSIATSLAAIIVTSASAAHAHFKIGNIDFLLARKLILTVMIGAFVGGGLAEYLSLIQLTYFFACATILLALQMLFSLNKVSKQGMPNNKVIYTLGLVTGVVSSLMGIGGGAILVPILTYFTFPIRKAMGIASLCGFFVAVFGTLGFIFSGVGESDLPNWSIGYVYVPALVGIIIPAFIFAPWGVKVAQKSPVQSLKKCFAVFLILVAIKMIWGVSF